MYAPWDQAVCNKYTFINLSIIVMIQHLLVHLPHVLYKSTETRDVEVYL